MNGPYKSALRKNVVKNPSAHFFDSKLESEVGSGFLDLVPLRLRVGNQNEVPPNLAHVYDGEFDARSIGTNIQSLWSLNRAPDGLLIFWGPMGTERNTLLKIEVPPNLTHPKCVEFDARSIGIKIKSPWPLNHPTKNGPI